MDESPKSAGASGKPFGVAFFAVAAVALSLTMVLRQSAQPSAAVGRPAPAIRAAGWLNGPGLSEADLRGKVIVVDAWAYWCGPCRRAAPELVALHKRYSDQGVVFVGLTIEGIEADAENRRFLEATKITWPNGYGAVETLRALNADYIPQRWVIDRTNKIIWDENSTQSIDSAIDRALKESS